MLHPHENAARRAYQSHLDSSHPVSQPPGQSAFSSPSPMLACSRCSQGTQPSTLILRSPPLERGACWASFKRRTTHTCHVRRRTVGMVTFFVDRSAETGGLAHRQWRRGWIHSVLCQTPLAKDISFILCGFNAIMPINHDTALHYSFLSHRRVEIDYR